MQSPEITQLEVQLIPLEIQFDKYVTVLAKTSNSWQIYWCT